MDANSPLTRLHTVLEQELRLVQSFMGVLETEERVLTGSGGDQDLADSTAAKNQHADRLAAAGEQRQELLSALGYGADRASLDALAADHPAFQPLCATLLDHARRANELNASNGVIIDTFLANNQQMLDTLRSLAGMVDLYDASGRSRPGANGRARSIKAG